MNTPQTASHIDDPTPASAGVLFARTYDGLLVAKVGDNAFVMMPGANGRRYYLASAWRLRPPMEEWRRADFYSHGGELENEAAFRARVHENAEHQRQRAALGRREIRSHANTPWGVSQGAIVYTGGVVVLSTAGHGLDAVRNAKVPPTLRASDGWYEEDCAWPAVAEAFPELFTDFERRCADRSIRGWNPDVWEAIHNRPVRPGESHEKDRRDFGRGHAAHWVVVSANRSDHYADMTDCVATLGGDRRAAEQRRHLVSADEYRPGRFGFVIDEARHPLHAGPSNFAGWR